MGVNDWLRRESHEVNDLLRLLEEERKLKHAERDGAKDRAKQLAAEVPGKRKEEEKFRAQLDTLRAAELAVERELKDLDLQRERVLERLREAHEDFLQGERGLRDLRDDADGLQRRLKEVVAEERDRDRALEELAVRHEELSQQLRQAHQRALSGHLQEVSDRLDAALMGDSERRMALGAAERLRSARHEDPVVADLWEQREQYRRLLEQATVPGVQQTLKGALTQVEHEIETRFPRALEGEKRRDAHAIEELPYFQGLEGRAVLCLPISQAAWRSSSDDGSGLASEKIARLVWALWPLLSDSGLTANQTHFQLVDGWCRVTAACTEEELALLEGCTLALPSGDKVHLRLTPLPRDVADAVVEGGAP